jgi:hypothetical protein
VQKDFCNKICHKRTHALQQIAFLSVAIAKTIGTVVLAAFAANAAGVLPGTAITLTERWSRSVINPDIRSFWPSAQRYSIATLPPSTTWPTSRSPCCNARTKLAYR